MSDLTPYSSIDEPNLFKEFAEIFNPEGIKNDLSESADLVREHLHDRIFNKITASVERHKSYARKNPSAQVKLLRAMKPFVREDSRIKIDEFAEMLQMLEAVNAMKSSLQKTLPPVNEAGIYSIDDRAYPNYGEAGAASGLDGYAPMLMMLMTLALTDNSSALKP